MENIEEMSKRHKKEINDLQDSCEHNSISDWMEYHWAPGHYSHDVKVCNTCGKIVEEKRNKFIIGEMTEDLADGRCLVEI